MPDAMSAWVVIGRSSRSRMVRSSTTRSIAALRSSELSDNSAFSKRSPYRLRFFFLRAVSRAKPLGFGAMTDRLQKLLRQRALIQEPLAWLDREIPENQEVPPLP